MLQPLVAQFTSRGMPAMETERELAELAGRLRLWDAIAKTTVHPSGDVSGIANITDRTVRFGEGAPEETLPAHLPRLLSASRAAVAAGTPVVIMSECTLVPPVLAAVREKHPGVALVWIDAHGDLNTPETSPSGNQWGMPLRMILDAGFVRAEDAALVGARSLDPSEAEFLAANGIDDSLDRALAGIDAVYVALDLDVLDPREADVLIPEASGFSADEVEALLREVVSRATLAGMGVTGFLATDRNAALAARMLAAAGL